jgi:hypothetical protein
MVKFSISKNFLVTPTLSETIAHFPSVKGERNSSQLIHSDG